MKLRLFSRLLVFSFFVVPIGGQAAEPVSAPRASIDFLTFLHKVSDSNPMLKSSSLSVQSAEAGLTSAKMEMLPTLSGGIGTMTARDTAGSARYNVYNVSFRQPLWAFGRITSDIEYAEAGVKVASISAEITKLKVLQDAAKDYLSAVRLHKTIVAYREYISDLDRLLSSASRRRDSGVSSSSEVGLIRSRLLSASAKMEGVKARYDGSLARLAIWAGINVSGVEGFVSKYFQDKLFVPYSQSADIEIAYQQALIEQARKDSSRALLSMLPTIYFQAEKGYVSGAINTPARYGIVLEGTVSSGGAAYQQYRSSVASAESAEYVLQQRVRERRSRVQELKSLIKGYNAMTASMRDGLSSTSRLLDSYRRQLTIGKKSWRDILSLKKELFDSRLALIDIEIKRYEAEMELVSILGTLSLLLEEKT